ncbi:MAG: hypothetical protein IID17_03140 [Nitrospinae bacterium]|nr:hypothetical protein [Nitrospinota bacterium]
MQLKGLYSFRGVLRVKFRRGGLGVNLFSWRGEDAGIVGMPLIFGMANNLPPLLNNVERLRLSEFQRALVFKPCLKQD